MDENKLKKFVIKLNSLPDSVKNNEVNMLSTFKPTCDTPGCHAGLISIVATYLPELKECYHVVCKHFADIYPNRRAYDYNYSNWARALNLFLGFELTEVELSNLPLCKWARDNEEIWGRKDGDYMFSSGRAFGQYSDFFNHRVIINQWSSVCDILNKKG